MKQIIKILTIIIFFVGFVFLIRSNGILGFFNPKLYPLYPKEMTSGHVLTGDSKTTCVSGYAKSVRNVSATTKKKVFENYGLNYPAPKGAYEVDHLISLCLGGSNDIKNLWPQPADVSMIDKSCAEKRGAKKWTAIAPEDYPECVRRYGFYEKDILESYLCRQVCEGKISLNSAQKKISNDWKKAYKEMVEAKFGNIFEKIEFEEEGNP